MQYITTNNQTKCSFLNLNNLEIWKSQWMLYRCK